MTKHPILIPYSLPKDQSLDQDELAQRYQNHQLGHQFLAILDAGVKQIRELDHSVNQGFQKSQQLQKQIHAALLNQTAQLHQDMERLEVAVSQGFTDVKASLDMGMAHIVSQIELQREALKEGFQEMSQLLENQLKTRAHERYLDGKLEYERFLQHPDEKQFLMDALTYFQESLEAYRGNPFCHLHLGHIYQKTEQPFDLEKAQTHYQLCATYAKGIQNDELTAIGYFMASWISYVRGEVSKAIQLGEKSIEYAPGSIPEAYYNLAKYHAHLEEAEPALQYLGKAIRDFDPYYAVKANLDPDFDSIQAALEAFFEQLKEEEIAYWHERLKTIKG